MASTSNVLEALKYTYGVNRVLYLFNEESVVYNILSRVKKPVGGRGQFIMPILTQNPGAFTGVSEGGAFPTALQPDTTEATFGLQEYVAVYDVSFKLIQDARNDKFAFQQAALDKCGIDARFEAWDVAPDELEAKVASFREPDCLGSCVTLPHKQAVIPLVDELAETATEVGAVNWIINDGGRLVGQLRQLLTEAVLLGLAGGLLGLALAALSLVLAGVWGLLVLGTAVGPRTITVLEAHARQPCQGSKPNVK